MYIGAITVERQSSSRKSKAASVGGLAIVRDDRLRRRPLINAAAASAWHACPDRRTAKLASGSSAQLRKVVAKYAPKTRAAIHSVALVIPSM
jgi:hypothetical protein